MSSDIQITTRVILMRTTQDNSILMIKFMILVDRVARGAHGSRNEVYNFSDLKKSKRSTIDTRVKFCDDMLLTRRSDEAMRCRDRRSTTTMCSKF